MQLLLNVHYWIVLNRLACSCQLSSTHPWSFLTDLLLLPADVSPSHLHLHLLPRRLLWLAQDVRYLLVAMVCGHEESSFAVLTGTVSQSGIAWNSVGDCDSVIGAQGIRQGVIKKHRGTRAAWCLVCERVMFEQFLSNVPVLLGERLRSMTYRQAKDAAQHYQEAKTRFLQLEPFREWVR